jgi:putative redox protein
MVTISMTYTGELRCEAVHTPSGNHLLTDAPVDNQGKGEAFSPTDLVAAALGTCILTTMGIVANKLGVKIDGASAEVTKEMAAQPPRRIARLTTTITMPTGIAAEHRQRLEHAAHHCPVHQSLHGEMEKPIRFIWAE